MARLVRAGTHSRGRAAPAVACGGQLSCRHGRVLGGRCRAARALVAAGNASAGAGGGLLPTAVAATAVATASASAMGVDTVSRLVPRPTRHAADTVGGVRPVDGRRARPATSRCMLSGHSRRTAPIGSDTARCPVAAADGGVWLHVAFWCTARGGRRPLPHLATVSTVATLWQTAGRWNITGYGLE